MVIEPENINYPRSYFFDRGLRFACQQCGTCCTGAPGTIFVSADEVCTIAAHLKVAEPVFIETYLYPFKSSYSIGEDTEGQCLFYDNGCRIYPVRPLQCRTFPFWFSNLRSQRAWQQVAVQCPGIGKGPVYTKEEIMALARSTMPI